VARLARFGDDIWHQMPSACYPMDEHHDDYNLADDGIGTVVPTCVGGRWEGGKGVTEGKTGVMEGTTGGLTRDVCVRVRGLGLGGEGAQKGCW
jgi:hypothetical protein